MAEEEYFDGTCEEIYAELDGWEGLNPLYDPFKEGQGLMRIMGPGLVGVMNVEVIE